MRMYALIITGGPKVWRVLDAPLEGWEPLDVVLGVLAEVSLHLLLDQFLQSPAAVLSDRGLDHPEKGKEHTLTLALF